MTKTFRLKSNPCGFLSFFKKGNVAKLFNNSDFFDVFHQPQFAKENDQLLSSMNDMMNDVKSIEGKVFEIARLQEMFNEQVKFNEKCISF